MERIMSNSIGLSQRVQASKAILFDLFHTLTAKESSWSGGRRYTHQVLGFDRVVWDRQLLERSRDRLVGKWRDPYYIISTMARDIDPNISEQLIREAVENRTRVFADTLLGIPEENQQVVHELKKRGKLIGLISNADVMEAAAWQDSPIAPLFDSVVFSCHVGSAKPEPTIYQIALNELGIEADEAVFVGDGGSDELQGARDVGITPIMVTNVIREAWPDRVTQRMHQASYVIEHLNELLA